MGSGLVGLCLKSMLPGKLFTLSKNGYPCKGQPLQSQQDPRSQNIRTQKIKDVVNITQPKSVRQGRSLVELCLLEQVWRAGLAPVILTEG